MEVVSLTPGVTVEPKLWRNKDAAPGPLLGIQPGTKLVLAAQGILADGTRLTPSLSSIEVTTRPC